MKNLILSMIIALAIVTPAAASTYCERAVDHPKPEVFRIGVSRENYKPHATDCEVLFKGSPASVRTCRINRCDASTVFGGH